MIAEYIYIVRRERIVPVGCVGCVGSVGSVGIMTKYLRMDASFCAEEARNRPQPRLVIIDLRQVFIKQHRLCLIATILLLLLRKYLDIRVFKRQCRQFRAMFLHRAHLILVLPDFLQRQP